MYHHFRRINPYEGSILGGGYCVEVIDSKSDLHMFKINKCSPEDNYNKKVGRTLNKSNPIMVSVPNASNNFMNDLVDFCFKEYSEDENIPHITDYHFRSFIKEMCNPRSRVTVGPIRQFQSFMNTCLHAYNDFMRKENVQTNY